MGNQEKYVSVEQLVNDMQRNRDVAWSFALANNASTICLSGDMLVDNVLLNSNGAEFYFNGQSLVVDLSANVEIDHLDEIGGTNYIIHDSGITLCFSSLSPLD